MHTDPELLSLLALGEQVGTDEDRSHAQTCPTCAGELSDLRRLVILGRGVGTDTGTELIVPHPRVWARIREDLAVQELEPLDPASSSAASPREVRTSGAPTREAVSTSPPQSLLALMEAALAGPSHGSAALVARATLAPVQAGWSHSSGEAMIATDALGRQILQLALDAELPHSGVRHAWLVHREDETRKQPLGILDGPYGVWTVDQSIDLEQYAIIDVSQQGASETEHSGQTIVRGQLTLVV